MIITQKWLKKVDACVEAINEYEHWIETDSIKIVEALVTGSGDAKDLTENVRLEWANWLICRLLDRVDRIRYAVFAARQVVDIYEKEYPEDNRIRKAIESAEAVIKNPDDKGLKSAARSAELAAESAARSAELAAESAAWSAARSAESAAWSAELAAWSAELAARSAELAARSAVWSTESAARSAVWSTAWSAELAARSAVRSNMFIKIVEYGISLLYRGEMR